MMVGVAAAAGARRAPVTVVNYSTPSPQALTGGVTSFRGNAQWPSVSVNSDHIRMNWPSWSDGTIRTNNTFNLTGCTRYEAEVDTTGMNSPYGGFYIGYPNSSGGTTNPYSYPRASPLGTYNITLTDTPGSGYIWLNGWNTFGDVKIYRLQFFYD